MDKVIIMELRIADPTGPKDKGSVKSKASAIV